MRAFFDRRFWSRFALLLAIALVPLLLSAVPASPDTTNLKEIAQQTAREFDRLIQLRQRQVFTIAAFPSVRGFTASSAATRSQRASVALNELQAWVAADTNVREAFIADESGIVIMTTLDGWNGDISNRQFIQDALAGQIAVSPVAQDQGEFSNYYAAPVLNNQNNIAGALVIRVAAQELWGITPHGANYYTILADDNGTRLDDSGDPARRLMTLGPLDTEHETRIVKTSLYGVQLPNPRTSDLKRAQDLITKGALDQLSAADFDAGAIAAQRLVSKPWTVIIAAPQPMVSGLVARLGIPLLVALLLSLAGAALLSRL